MFFLLFQAGSPGVRLKMHFKGNEKICVIDPAAKSAMIAFHRARSVCFPDHRYCSCFFRRRIESVLDNSAIIRKFV
jgi:hypothetical protein